MRPGTIPGSRCSTNFIPPSSWGQRPERALPHFLDPSSATPRWRWRRQFALSNGRNPMKKTLIGGRLAALTLGLAAVGLAQAADPLQPYPVKGQVVQRLNAFDNPEGS